MTLVEKYFKLIEEVNLAPIEEQTQFKVLVIKYLATLNRALNEAKLDMIPEVWVLVGEGVCGSCGAEVPRRYRLKQTKYYNKNKATPVYRCEQCSIAKYEELKRLNKL